MNTEVRRSKVLAPPTTRLQAIRLAPLADEEDVLRDAELLLSTHLTVVVRARLAFAGGTALEFSEVGLVIARQHCEGDRPFWSALLVAAERYAAQAAIKPRQVQVCIDSHWMTLFDAVDSVAMLKGTNPMNTSNRFQMSAALSCAGLLAFASATPAVAGTAEANYRQERANCLNGNTSQDRKTCLREAGAALQDARRGGLSSPSPIVIAQNAEARCQIQRPEDRADCVRLARGEGSQEGSVAEGAIVRQIDTLKVEPTAAGPNH